MNEVLLSLEELLLLSDPEVAVMSAEDDGEAIWIGIARKSAGAECPGCGRWSNRLHGSYLRFPADLPSAGRRVVLRLQVRRFTCAETEVGLALAGPAGARLADVFGISVSRSTVLRLVDAMPAPQPSSPRVGIDEYAMRKGRICETVLVNVETGRPVDLLPDREAATVAVWLAECPEVEVVGRDRAPVFAEGASTGAPTAVQVADRFGLWRNLGEAAERCVSRHRTCLRAPFAVPHSDSVTASPAPEAGASPWPTGHRSADRTREKHAIVHEMLREGHSRRAVARQLRMTYRTVQRLAHAASPEDLFPGQWQNRRTKLDGFKPHLHERWAEGCTNAWTLWKEIQSHGYAGGYGTVRGYLRPFRNSVPDGQPPSPRTVPGGS